MSKQQKLLDRLSAKPTPANIKWTELKTALESLGYRVINNKGVRRKFFNEQRGLLIICHAPHPSPDVEKGCIDAVVDHLREHGLIGD